MGMLAKIITRVCVCVCSGMLCGRVLSCGDRVTVLTCEGRSPGAVAIVNIQEWSVTCLSHALMKGLC